MALMLIRVVKIVLVTIITKTDN
jgi:hypothetical protein